MSKRILMAMAGLTLLFGSCTQNNENSAKDDFAYEVDEFADLQILRYNVPEFDSLSLKQKELIYYLSQAAIEGRDILYDQNGRYNLAVRRTLEAIYENYKGDKNSEEYARFLVYLKRVWFSNGIHHHYGQDKFLPEFSKEFFADQVRQLPPNLVPVQDGQSVDQYIEMIVPIMFDPAVMAKKINQAVGVDLIKTSANNYYGEGVSQDEVEAFYAMMKTPNDTTPVMFGLNSRLVKENGKLTEKKWTADGLYAPAINRIITWLDKAKTVAENEHQTKTIEKLKEFYTNGNLATFDEYSIAWVQDSISEVDFVNGFIESYGDPLGMKASWESVVNFKNTKATNRTQTISDNAQWFEDHSPVDKRFKKEKVKGVTAKVITVAQLGGDCYPSTPIGINLPNSNWIRKDYGSKSVTIENIMEAYDKASEHSGFNEEFVWSAQELDLLRKYGFLTDVLHTDLHEILGHGSGQLLPGVDSDALKAYGATIEEARADLFALYYLPDNKLVDLGIIPNSEAYKAEYYRFIMNGLLTQLTRIEAGKDVEESHMRNRQLIAKWVYEKGRNENVIELKKRDDKTFVAINDYVKLRNLFGELLAEIQRVKSEGDYEGAKDLVENYAVKVDRNVHEEILARFKKLNLKPYKGFVNPVYKPVYDNNGNIMDIKIDYSEGYADQMMRYSKEFSSLPAYND